MTKRTPIVAPKHNKGPIAGDGKVGQDAPRYIPTTGPAVATEPEIEPIVLESQLKQDKIEKLAFMEEMVEVTVLPSNEKNAAQIVHVENNGRRQFFVRGRPQRVRRKFVECLARAKHTNLSTDISLDPSGEPLNRITPTTGLLYPFQVNEDSARGRAWLQEVLAEA